MLLFFFFFTIRKHSGWYYFDTIWGVGVAGKTLEQPL